MLSAPMPGRSLYVVTTARSASSVVVKAPRVATAAPRMIPPRPAIERNDLSRTASTKAGKVRRQGWGDGSGVADAPVVAAARQIEGTGWTLFFCYAMLIIYVHFLTKCCHLGLQCFQAGPVFFFGDDPEPKFERSFGSTQKKK